MQLWAQEGWASSEPPLASVQACSHPPSARASPGAEVEGDRSQETTRGEKAGRQRGHQRGHQEPLPRSRETEDTDSDVGPSGAAQDLGKDSSSKTDERSFTDNQVHFTDGNTEARGLESKAPARRSQRLLSPSLRATAGQGQGRWRPVSWRRTGNHRAGATPVTPHPPAHQVAAHLPAGNSSPPRAPPTGPRLPSAGCTESPRPLSPAPGPGEAELAGVPGVRAGGRRCVPSVPLDVLVAGLEGGGGR